MDQWILYYILWIAGSWFIRRRTYHHPHLRSLTYKRKDVHATNIADGKNVVNMIFNNNVINALILYQYKQ